MQHLIDKSKQILNEAGVINESFESSKRLVVKRKSRDGVVKKTLTVATPFKLRTD